MPRPEQKRIQLTIDGLQIEATEGEMLLEAARLGDVEIPYFCFERKLGDPVGACRMCLVEIEGVPKLQTSCSTPVKDGMVVHTQTDRVRAAQNAIVEFLLVNHPLDCPVCDKGGECPLQDITFGWGLGRSRVVEPKRHFEKPLALSPLVAIDRERCILCYRCVRFSQEIAEDWQLIFAHRGADTFVATHDGHPYVAPFSGNIVELCPVGALTSRPYRFRARPWDIEGAGGICTLCPAQCNVDFTVRDEKVLRVLARDPGNEGVDDGWLCDKGRFAYQAIHADERITSPLVRDGDRLRAVSWERALQTATGLARHRGRVAALAGGQATNEEGFLLARLLREGLDSHDLDCRPAGSVSLDCLRALAAPGLAASVPDLEFAHTVLLLDAEPLDEAPILDLRIRKGVRRNAVKLLIASARPSALDPNAELVLRLTPRGADELAERLARALRGQDAGEDVAALARALRDGGHDVVIVYSERLGEAGRRALAAIAGALALAGHAGAGLLELPAGANGRGLREAGFLPNAGPGYSEPAVRGRDAAEIAAAAAAGEVTALYLLQTDPVRDLPDRGAWEAAMRHASLVVAHATTLTEGLREHADVVFPAESWAEKEGTVVHPDGRLQRLRVAIAHPGEVRPTWSVIAELSKLCGYDQDVLTSPMAFARLVAAVPFYEGITLEEIGARGLRWPERAQAASMPQAQWASTAQGAPAAQPPAAQGAPTAAQGAAATLALGTYRPIWAAPEVEISPALAFTIAHQQLELSPSDARRLGIAHGQQVTVSQNGTRLRARAAIRSDVPAGSAFLAEGIAEDSANALTGAQVEVSAR